MRMEELENNNFIKGTDTVEKYLLNLIRDYFAVNQELNNTSQEYIIQRAVARMKDELNIDNAGVVSINGNTGDIVITCESMGAEPLILDKKTAFNVNFGIEARTACEGNDPRLSDKRIPKTHTHEITDINGLQAAISSVQNLINSLDNRSHSHSNKDVIDKLIYTGDKNTIDLTIIDTLKDDITNKINEIDKLISQYKTVLDGFVEDTQTKIDNLS